MPEHHNTHDFDDDEELDDEAFDAGEYDVMLELERLESLEEDMVEMKVTTLEEVRLRLAELHRRLDEGK
jgi:hypothetical protein